MYGLHRVQVPHHGYAVATEVAGEVEGGASPLDAAVLSCSKVVPESEGVASMLDASVVLGQTAVPAA